MVTEPPGPHLTSEPVIPRSYPRGEIFQTCVKKEYPNLKIRFPEKRRASWRSDTGSGRSSRIPTVRARARRSRRPPNWSPPEDIAGVDISRGGCWARIFVPQTLWGGSQGRSRRNLFCPLRIYSDPIHRRGPSGRDGTRTQRRRRRNRTFK